MSTEKNASIGEFDLNDAIRRTADRTNDDRAHTERIIKTFLNETENALAEHGRVEYLGHFSITLRKRKPRSGMLHGKAWSTPARVEPEFQAFDDLKALVLEKQGIECV